MTGRPMGNAAVLLEGKLLADSRIEQAGGPQSRGPAGTHEPQLLTSKCSPTGVPVRTAACSHRWTENRPR